MWEPQVEFNWCLTEDYGRGDSISGVSEKLSQKHEGGGQCVCGVGREGHAVKHTSPYKAAAGHKEQVS